MGAEVKDGLGVVERRSEVGGMGRKWIFCKILPVFFRMWMWLMWSITE